MAKLRFFYSVMNAGKTVQLLQVNHNYTQNHNRDTVLLTHAVDDRFGADKISSRIGIEADALSVNDTFNIFEYVKEQLKHRNIACILVDEVQFFSSKHIWQLSDVVDELNIPVMCYGIRANSNGTLFEGSKTLFEIADEIQEIKQVCFCGSVASMVLKFTNDGRVTKQGKVVDVGAEEKYISVCRKHWKKITHIDEIETLKKFNNRSLKDGTKY